MKAGKHVLCEKPLAMSADDAAALDFIAKQAGKVLKVGFNYRYMAHVQKAKDLIELGKIGKPYFLRCKFGHGGRVGYEQDWCTNVGLSGGGVLLEQGIHVFDLVRYLFGEPTSVVATVDQFHFPLLSAEDNGFVMMRCGEKVAQFHISWTNWKNVFELELYGSDGYLRLEGRDGHYGPQRLVFGTRKPDHSRPEEIEWNWPTDRAWSMEWKEFRDAIAENRQPNGSAADGARAQALVEAAYRSADGDGWVEV